MTRWHLSAELGRTQKGTFLEVAADQCWIGKIDGNYFMVAIRNYVQLLRHQCLGTVQCLAGTKHCNIAQPLIKPRRGMFKTAALLPLLMKLLMRNRFLSPLPGVSGHSCVFGAMRLKVLL